MKTYLGAYWAVDDATSETHTHLVNIEAENWEQAFEKIGTWCFFNFPLEEGYYLHGHTIELMENVELI